MRIASRFFALVLLVSALTLAVGQSAGVRADNFTDVGCPSGNYSCLAANGGQLPPQGYPYYGYGQNDPFAAIGCSDNDYNCYYAKTGVNYTPATTNPFAAAGCADYDYGCLNSKGYGTGIAVNPVAQATAPALPSTVFTNASSDNTVPGIVTSTGG